MRTSLIVLMTVLIIGGGAVLAGEATGNRHPHFDDGGALRWYTRLADAQAAAKKEDKIILIEYGRKV